MLDTIDWAALFRPDVTWLEIFVRGTCTYLGLLALLRITPNRELATVSHTNLLVVVLLADASQNAMSGDYRSISAGLVLVGTLLFWSLIIDVASYRWAGFRRLVQPPPVRLIRNGRVIGRALRSELLSVAELESQLRQRGIDDVRRVKEAWLEPDGQLSVIEQGGRAGSQPGDVGGAARASRA
ncbi:MAG TPA: YetF domain-containing protein [Calidithermus sp.]|jgi:uncharacterized membrane protein YcaP (DUF421 family)|nr:YetF domain-containing protein [Calidithermus sp.]